MVAPGASHLGTWESTDLNLEKPGLARSDFFAAKPRQLANSPTPRQRELTCKNINTLPSQSEKAVPLKAGCLP
jgi:hypothetical protein